MTVKMAHLVLLISAVISLVCHVLINCQDIKNTAISFKIREELPATTRVGDVPEISGINANYSQKERAKFMYHITSPTSDQARALFTVSPTSGLIKTAKKIDREDICPKQPTCVYIVVISVTPSDFFQLITVSIEIIDENDNKPTFPEPSLHISIPESSGELVRSLPAAKDLDSGNFGIDHYELVTVDRRLSGFFDLEETVSLDGSTELKLKALKALDRESVAFHQLLLKAFDGSTPPKSGVLPINITIEDINDNPPLFDKAEYRIDVPENTTINEPILTVSAHDRDIGPNGEIIFQFTKRTAENVRNMFYIDSVSGEIYLSRKLDYEEETKYLLVVTAKNKAADTQTAQVAVHINVTDLNDCPPTININTLGSSDQAKVEENKPVGTVVSYVTFGDKDSGESGRVVCGLNTSAFQLNQAGVNKAVIVTNAIFDRETTSRYVLNLTCTDNGRPKLSSSRTLVVKVLDVNDHAPRFSEEIYHASIRENLIPPRFLLTALATDQDIGRNGRLEYTLVNDRFDELNQLFEITNEGVLRTKVPLDREMYSSVSFRIVAKDNGKPPKNSSAQVSIDIEDENDCKPEFSDDNYSFGILENSSPGTDTGNVAVHDADSTEYSHVSFKLDADDLTSLQRFGINRNGHITSKVTLDREEQSHYYLRVISYNPGYPDTSSTASVTINVNDVNDNSPIIEFPTPSNNTVEVRSNVGPGFVITKIKARDLDLGQNALLTFGLLDGNATLFNIDPMLGAVTLLQDFEKIFETTTAATKEFNLTILVKDLGDHQRNATAVLVVVVKPGGYSPAISDDANSTGGVLGDYTIVIGLTCGSLFVIVFLMLAIIWLACKGGRSAGPAGKPEQGKYNCRVEAQRMLNGKLDRESPASRSSPSITGSLGHPVSTQDQVHIILNHADSGTGMSLSEYTPDNGSVSTHGVKTWPPQGPQSGRETQVSGLSPSSHSELSPRSPPTDKSSIDSGQPHAPVCNSCVVTSDNDRFATKLVPLTDKEIEIHKILKFLHSQQEDSTSTVPDGHCSDNMSTSDSGKGASVSEECETPAYNNISVSNPVTSSSHSVPMAPSLTTNTSKPSNSHKQVTFYNVPPSKDEEVCGGGECYNSGGRPSSQQQQQQQQHRYKGGQKMTTFSASSPTTSANNSLTRPGKNIPQPASVSGVGSNNGLNSVESSQRNRPPGGGGYYNKGYPQRPDSKSPPLPVTASVYASKNKPNYRSQKPSNSYGSYDRKYTGSGGPTSRVGKGFVGDSDSVQDYISDADTTSTMSGTYVLSHDDPAGSHRVDFSGMRDSVV